MQYLICGYNADDAGMQCYVQLKSEFSSENVSKLLRERATHVEIATRSALRYERNNLKKDYHISFGEMWLASAPTDVKDDREFLKQLQVLKWPDYLSSVWMRWKKRP